MAYKILLVEDDPELIEIISDYFTEKSGGALVLDTAKTGEEGMAKCVEHGFDLVLLDVMLPEIDGFTICRELRKHSDVPIIFLTARHDEMDRLHGYHMGCDDYVTKPFSLAELYAKVTALIKRTKGMVRNETIEVGKIKLNPLSYTVVVDDEEVMLTSTQFAILKILMENAGKVVSRESLIIRIWGYDFDGDERVIDNHIKKLRRALGHAAGQIKTVYKQGYKLEGRD